MDLQIGRSLTESEIVHLLAEARGRTLLLTAAVSDDDLRRQHDPLMSPIVWDLGHIAHFEEVWLIENLEDGGGSEGLRGLYNPFENPRAVRDSLPLPSLVEARTYLASVRQAVQRHLSGIDLDRNTRTLRDGFVFRMVLQHEYQHNETILQTLQLKQGDPYTPPRALAPPPVDPGNGPAPGSMVRVPGGVVPIGTDEISVAYDNERPAHAITLDPFWIDVHPVTNGEYLAFVEAGGYDDPAHWSEEGWAWRQEDGLTAPKYWTHSEGGWTERFMDRVVALAPNRPVVHICYWEADAYARWAGKRLPTEAEWEAAASWDPETGKKGLFPWGDDAPTANHGNLDALLFETTEIGSYPAGVSAAGCWGMLGDVWEWTSTDFHGYPGYETFPYPEYSEVFFGSEYKVLRGGSWASRFGAVRNTFRNWDYPIRRQIFSGVRCARDEDA